MSHRIICTSFWIIKMMIICCSSFDYSRLPQPSDLPKRYLTDLEKLLYNTQITANNNRRKFLLFCLKNLQADFFASFFQVPQHFIKTSRSSPSSPSKLVNWLVSSNGTKNNKKKSLCTKKRFLIQKNMSSQRCQSSTGVGQFGFHPSI